MRMSPGFSNRLPARPDTGSALAARASPSPPTQNTLTRQKSFWHGSPVKIPSESGPCLVVLPAIAKSLAAQSFSMPPPFNKVFAESVPLLRDFYNNPAYADLLNVTQEEFNAAATGQVTAQQAMDIVAQKHTEILTRAGLLK